MPVMTAVLDDDDRKVLREVMEQLPGTYKNNPIPMPGSFFVNKLLKIYNEATVHPLSGNEYPMTGKTVVTLVGFTMMTITFTGGYQHDGTR